MNRTNMDFDVLLESYVTTYYEGTKYNTLNEAEKVKFADQIVTKLFKDVKNKTLKQDDAGIAKTKGDFTKHSSYKTIGRAIRFLEASDPDANLAERIKVIKDTHQLLAANKDIFKNAFQYGNDVLIVSYINICNGLIIATSEAISLSTQMVQQKKLGANVGNRSFGCKSNYIEGLKQANELMRTNKLRTMHDKIVVKNEAFLDNIKGMMAKHTILSAIACVIAVLASMKRICFTYYHSRIKLADHLRNTAEYVQMKSEGISDSNVKAKQQKWIDKLMQFAEKVDIDSKSANAKANEEIARTDQEFAELPSTWIM